LPHGGEVFRCGTTGLNGEHKHVIEYSLKLDSNAEFTASVLVACARAVYRMNKGGMYGCKTLFDVPPVYLSAKSREELLAELL
jgi:diaminopimelate dehydrogenase